MYYWRSFKGPILCPLKTLAMQTPARLALFTAEHFCFLYHQFVWMERTSDEGMTQLSFFFNLIVTTCQRLSKSSVCLFCFQYQINGSMNEARSGGGHVALMKLNDGFDIISPPPLELFFLVSHQRTRHCCGPPLHHKHTILIVFSVLFFTGHWCLPSKLSGLTLSPLNNRSVDSTLCSLDGWFFEEQLCLHNILLAFSTLSGTVGIVWRV